MTGGLFPYFVIMSHDKPNEICPTVSWMLDYGFHDYYVVISHDDDEEGYNNLYPRVIVAPKSCDNLAKKKIWAIHHFAKDNGWMVMIDDNVSKVTGFAGDKKIKKDKDYSQILSPEKLMDIVEHDIRIAEGIGANMGGFSYWSNSLYRRDRYLRSIGFVQGKLRYYRNTGKLNWFTDLLEMDDWASYLYYLQRDGAVLINYNVFPVCAIPMKKKWTQTRLDNLVKAKKKILERYAPLVKDLNPEHIPLKTDLVLNMKFAKQIQKERVELFKPSIVL